jgi:hypothetical protein
MRRAVTTTSVTSAEVMPAANVTAGQVDAIATVVAAASAQCACFIATPND